MIHMDLLAGERGTHTLSRKSISLARKGRRVWRIGPSHLRILI